MFTQERVRFCLAKHPEWTDKRVAKSMATTMAVVRDIRSGVMSTPQPEANAVSGGNGLITLQSIVEKYDTRGAILKEIAELPADKIITEADLCQRTSGMDRNRFRRTCENCAKEFDSLRIRIKLEKEREPVWVWGHASAIETLKKAVNPW